MITREHLESLVADLDDNDPIDLTKHGQGHLPIGARCVVMPGVSGTVISHDEDGAATVRCKVRGVRHALRLLAASLVLFLLASGTAQAQQVDLGLDVGRAYSVADGAWVPSVIPSVSMLFGPVTLSTSTYLSGRRFFEQDTILEWWSREAARNRLTFFAYVGHYKYPRGYDWAGQVGVRYRAR